MLSTRKEFKHLLAEHWPLVLLLVSAVSILKWTTLKFVEMLDEGMLSSTALGISRGMVLYRDLFEFWTPLSVYLTAGSFWLFGPSILTLRILAAVLLILNTLCIYYLICQMSPRKAFRLLGTLAFMVTTFSFVEMNHHWVGMLFLLLTLISLSKLIRYRNLIWSITSGFCIGLTIMAMQFEGVVAILVCATTLIFWFKPNRGVNYKIWLTVSGAALAPISVVLIYFAAVGGLNDLLYSTIIFPLQNYGSVNNSLTIAPQMARVLIMASLAFYWFKKFDSPAAKLWFIALIIMQSLLILTTNNSISTRYSFLLSVVLVGCGLAIFRYQDLHHKVACLLDNVFGYLKITWVLIIAILTIAAYGFTAGETIGVWKNIHAANQKINTPAGEMYAKPDTAMKAQIIVNYIAKHAGGENIYVGPFAAHYQFLTLHPPSIKFSQLTPIYNPDWMFKQAINQLQDEQVKTIVLLPQENPFEFKQDSQLAQYVIKNYEPVLFLPFTSSLPSEKLFSQTYKRMSQNSPTDAIWRLKE